MGYELTWSFYRIGLQCPNCNTQNVDIIKASTFGVFKCANGHTFISNHYEGGFSLDKADGLWMYYLSSEDKNEELKVS